MLYFHNTSSYQDSEKNTCTIYTKLLVKEEKDPKEE